MKVKSCSRLRRWKELLGTSAVPVAVVHGDEDRIVNCTVGKYTYELLRDGGDPRKVGKGTSSSSGGGSGSGAATGGGDGGDDVGNTVHLHVMPGTGHRFRAGEYRDISEFVLANVRRSKL